MLALMVIFGGSLTSAAGGSSMQSGTVTPVATVPLTQAPAVAPTTMITQTASSDPTDDLTTATVNLYAGYIMDPYLLPVVGKTEKAASDVVQGCNGFVGAAPSVLISWLGKTDQLNAFVYSDGDAVLAVQLPDGSFICNDDAGPRTVDPLVSIKSPAPGTYRFHVGAANKDQPALGFLGITQAQLDDARLAELDLTPMLRRRERPRPHAAAQLDPGTLWTWRTPIFGSAQLRSGFTPVRAFVAGGGDVAAVKVEDQKLACAGYISPIPSYSFTWSGSPQAIRMFVEAGRDSSLAVVTPDRKVVCGMNADAANLNPVVDIASPMPGPYYVYVGAMQPGAVVGGALTITSDSKAAPAVLAPASQ
jgi:hypothetical protein